jgi:hypothetical protein
MRQRKTIGWLRASVSGALVVASIAAGAAAQSAEPTPDFAGHWARYSLEFEDPEQGPGPIQTMVRNPDGTPGDAKAGDYTNPILKPEAAARLKAFGEIAQKGVVFPDPENQCMPWPLPNILRYLEIEILQQPNAVTILYSRSHQVRRVRMNGSHPANIVPSSYGDSIGHYEGATLVVDTVGIKVGPLAMIDWYGTPYSKALHVVERYRLIDYATAKQAMESHLKRSLLIPPDDSGIEVDESYMGKGLQIEFTVEDPGVFTGPWSAAVTYRRAANAWVEDVCAENLRESGGPERKVPTAVRPDF